MLQSGGTRSRDRVCTIGADVRSSSIGLIHGDRSQAASHDSNVSTSFQRDRKRNASAKIAHAGVTDCCTAEPAVEVAWLAVGNDESLVGSDSE
jgi:hypothetical protein